MPLMPVAIVQGTATDLSALWKLFPADKPPTSPSSFDDEFDASSLDAKWSWRNQSTSTWVQDGTGVGVMAVPASAGQNVRVLEQTAPVGNFTMTMKFARTIVIDSTTYFGPCFINNSSGKLFQFSIATPGAGKQKTRGNRWTTATSYSVNVIDRDLDGLGGYVYMKVVYDGTTLSGYISADGKAWSLIGSETVATFIASFDRFGFGIESESGAAYEIGLHFFRVTQP